MPRFRFLPGLILGLLIGIVVGAMLPTLILPPPPQEPSLTSLKVQELTRELEASRRERDALNRQVDEFRVLANQMTSAFTDLERRFRALEEEMRLREAREQARLPATPSGAASAPDTGAAPSAAGGGLPGETPLQAQEPQAQ